MGIYSSSQSPETDKLSSGKPDQVSPVQFGSGQAFDMLATVMEHTPLMMSFLDCQLKYVLVSRSLSEFVGLPVEEMTGRTPFEIEPETESSLRPLLQTVIETANPVSGKALHLPYKSQILPDNKESFWNFTCTPVLDQAGQILGVLSISEDVTEQELQRRMLEEAASQAKQKALQLETILGSISDGLVVIDAQGLIVQSNATADQLLGRPMLGQNPYRDGPVIHKRRHLDGKPMQQKETISGRVLAGETFSDFRFIIADINGQDHIISSSGTPIFDEKGAVLGGVLLFRDVTHQEHQWQELEEARRANEESQNALLEMADAATGITDLEELLQRIVAIVPRVTGCDRAGIALYDPETELSTNTAVYGLPPAQAEEWKQMPPAPRDHTSPYDALFFEQHQSLVLDMAEFEEQARQQGQELPNPYGIKTLFATPLVYKGEVIGLLTLDHDGKTHNFTSREIKVLEGLGRLAATAIQNLRLLNAANQAETLREANRLKDEFLSLVAHELRNPLTAVQGYTQMTQRRLRKAGIPETDLRPLETIIGQAQRMTRLVEDMLDLSRIETGRLELRPEECNLAEQINRSIETYEANADNFKLDFELASGSDQGQYTGFFDCVRIDQVISNLLSNAIKYSPDGGTILLRLVRQKLAETGITFSFPANPQEEVFHFSIQDPGIGIPLEQQASLFARFYRANNSRDSGLPGLGLGLYISSQIIVRHGGQMWAESQGEGQGSTFHFILPVVLEETVNPDPDVTE